MPKKRLHNKQLDRIQLYSFLALAAVLICSFISDHQQEQYQPRPWKVKAYINNYLYLAQEIELHDGIPVPVTLAVAGLESDWGRSELAKRANNHFGIKVKPGWRGHEYCKDTQEYKDPATPVNIWACFRKYPLIRRSYQDFAQFLKDGDRYQALQNLELNDYPAWAEGLQAGGYATDPDYAQKLRGLIWKYRLSEFHAN